jgi:hypothetical protein
MTIDKTQADAIATQISQDASAGLDIFAAIQPQYAALALIGKAIASQIPGMTDSVVRLLTKAEPTDADVAALQTELAALMHPETL